VSKRILVVEDQEDNRQILRDLLDSAGYEMTEAWDGEAGVSAAKEQRPDLILMDIQLPHMDGYEATRRIKADPELNGIPIIAVTSYALSGDDGKAHAAGCHKALQPARPAGKNSSVPAPISRDRLLHCICRLVARRRHGVMSALRSLSGLNRTNAGQAKIDVDDPKRTLPSANLTTSNLPV
jgi:two-component system, cell cycle response regulator DivK